MLTKRKLMSEKDLKNITKEWHFLLQKQSMYQDDITILNPCAPKR